MLHSTKESAQRAAAPVARLRLAARRVRSNRAMADTRRAQLGFGVSCKSADCKHR